MDKPRSEPEVLIVDKGYDSDPSVKTSLQEAPNLSSRRARTAKSRLPSTVSYAPSGTSSSDASQNSNTAACMHKVVDQTFCQHGQTALTSALHYDLLAPGKKYYPFDNHIGRRLNASTASA